MVKTEQVQGLTRQQHLWIASAIWILVTQVASYYRYPSPLQS